MLEATPQIVDRLLRPMMRTIGVENTFLPYANGAEIYQRSERAKR